MNEFNVNDFKEQIEEMQYILTDIFLGNPFDLIEIDMSKVPSHCVFMSDTHNERGTIFKVNDSELKRNLYEFIKEYPDKVFRGQKQGW